MPPLRRTLRVAAVALLVLPSLAAAAEVQTQGPELWPGKSEVSAHFGFQTGLTTAYNVGGSTPGGFKMLYDYSLRVNDYPLFTLWLNAGVDFVIGGGGCTPVGNNFVSCNGFSNGYTVDPHAGVKLKFKVQSIPLVPYAKIDLEIDGIVGRACGDNGAAIAGRAAGGVKYYLLKNLGLGIETGFAFGPAFYSGSNNSCAEMYSAHTEFYATWDFAIGAEFVF